MGETQAQLKQEEERSKEEELMRRKESVAEQKQDRWKEGKWW